jgi:hypothetical protein
MVANMRIQLELPEAQVQDLKKLMAEAGLDTYKDIFNHALSAFEWMLNEVKSGRSIASVDERNQSHRVLVMPALQQVARTVRKEQPVFSASR